MKYVPGTENILSDSLLRLYAFDKPGTVHTRSEYTYHNIIDNNVMLTHLVSAPLLVGREGKNECLPSADKPVSKSAVEIADNLANHNGDQAPEVSQVPQSGAKLRRAYRRKVVPPAETG